MTSRGPANANAKMAVQTLSLRSGLGHLLELRSYKDGACKSPYLQEKNPCPESFAGGLKPRNVIIVNIMMVIVRRSGR